MFNETPFCFIGELLLQSPAKAGPNICMYIFEIGKNNVSVAVFYHANLSRWYKDNLYFS